MFSISYLGTVLNFTSAMRNRRQVSTFGAFNIAVVGTYCSQGTTNICSSSTIVKVPPKGGRKTQNIFSFLFFLEFFSLENDRGKNEVRQIRSGDKRRVEQR